MRMRMFGRVGVDVVYNVKHWPRDDLIGYIPHVNPYMNSSPVPSIKSHTHPTSIPFSPPLHYSIPVHSSRLKSIK